MASTTIDVDYLSAYLSVPQTTLSTVIDAPTADLVRSVLAAITAKALDYDELAADKLRLDIELENAVRTSESRTESLKCNLDKAQKTIEELRTRLNEEENAKSSLHNELQACKASSTTTTSEIEILRARIATLESANRETLSIVELKSTANDELSKELQKQHQKGLELNQQIIHLQQEVQNAKSDTNSASFREGSLKQELELAKRNNEWYEAELKTKSAETLRYRKEKGARVAELQRENEELTSNLEALKRTEQALRTRLDEVQKKAEDYLTKVQQLQEDAAKTEDGYRQELESSQRLAKLQSQQIETHRSRLREVEAEIEKIKDDAAEEVGRCRAEAEAERQDREQAEHRIAELEADIEQLEARVAQSVSRPGTPRQGLNNSLGLGSSGSPFGTPGSLRSKSVMTATQVMEELYKAKTALKRETVRAEGLKQQIDEMVVGLELKKPYIDELEAEHARLENEVVEISNFADQIGHERDSARKEARLFKNEASTAQAETKILTQQLRDLAFQVTMLLAEQKAQADGLDELSSSDRLRYESLARGVVPDDSLDGLTPTDRLISQRLVVFRNMAEIQQKNQEQLKLIRQLGAQMESEEAVAAKHQAAQDHEEVAKLQVKIENYKDELQNLVTRSESYIKERDMFRRMLQHRGQLPPASDLNSIFGQSVDVNHNGLMQTIEPHNSNANANFAVLLKDLQAQYDQYREEQSIDRKTLKEQTERLSQEKGTLQAEIARISSQLTLINERYDLLNSNYAMLGNENKELQKRSQTLSEAAAKQDLKTQQVAEDLIEARSLLETMRNENANLKAEKNLWKDIQDRLSQDNESLMNERTRLNALIANQQTLQNERELSESEIRRRLQSQVESLEAELNTTKRKLANEIEENKKVQLRKEYESQQNQKRIDDVVSSLSQVREELVAAKTSRDHLKTRVDELVIELKSAEERVHLLQPARPTPRVSNGEDIDTDLNREQELSIEVSELRRDLDLAKSELEGAKVQMEQYKSFAQSTEEEMESLNATSEQFRDDMDRIIEEKNQKIRELEQRTEDISAELVTTNNELTTWRNRQGEVSRKCEEEKARLEAEITRLKDEEERYAIAGRFHQQDLRAQAEIATKAQQDYENELVKHAEAAKLVQTVRVELNQLKTESAGLRAKAESAQIALSQSEASWEERQEKLEQELKELRSRRDDLIIQNKLLHQQLESISAQVTSLQQTRAIGNHTELGSPIWNMTLDHSADGLRELNTFLRREKEIIEVQYDLKVQEARRLQQQLDYAQSQLDETRLKLDQERRSQADITRSSVAHKDLMDKVSELNLYRESSATLRNECRQAQAQLTEKTKCVESLLEKIQPLEAKIRELEHAKEISEGEMRLLQEDRDRWQKRTQDIISKYDRIDPAEMEQLKETIGLLRAERDSLLEERQPMQEKIDNFETEKTGWQQSRQKLIEQAKERNRINTKDIKDRTGERDAALLEKEALEQQLTNVRQELMKALQDNNAVEQQLSAIKQELEFVKSEHDQALSATSHQQTAPENLMRPTVPVDPTGDQQLSQLHQSLERVTQENQALEAKVQELQEQLEVVNSERDRAVAEAAEARTQHTNTEIENGHEEGQIDEAPISSSLAETERKVLQEQIVEAQAKVKEHEEKAKLIEQEMENKLKKRSDAMKTALNKKLAESKLTQRTELEDEYKLKIEQEKRIWLAESQIDGPATANSALEAPSAASIPNSNQSVANFSIANISDDDVRQLCKTHHLLREIMKGNIIQKVTIETQKLKDEHAKVLAEAQLKADTTKAQAVSMESKKSALKINMTENRIRMASGKLHIVEIAAKSTPERPVGEVWKEVLEYKPPNAPAPIPPAPATAAPVPNGIVALPSSVPSAIPVTHAPAESTTTTITATTTPNAINDAPSTPTIGTPTAHPIPQRVSSIPMMRGAPSMRGRGGSQTYQAPRGNMQGGSRGRGGGPNRGGLHPGAPPYNPPGGPVGVKRPRDDASTPGSTGKRPRGG